MTILQVVLEIIEDQVKRGSRIYEREHVRAVYSVPCAGPLQRMLQTLLRK